MCTIIVIVIIIIFIMSMQKGQDAHGATGARPRKQFPLVPAPPDSRRCISIHKKGEYKQDIYTVYANALKTYLSRILPNPPGSSPNKWIDTSPRCAERTSPMPLETVFGGGTSWCVNMAMGKK